MWCSPSPFCWRGTSRPGESSASRRQQLDVGLGDFYQAYPPAVDQRPRACTTTAPKTDSTQAIAASDIVAANGDVVDLSQLDVTRLLIVSTENRQPFLADARAKLRMW